MISGGGSAERDLREHDREASERAAARRRSLRAARDVYGAVGFDSLWADGICEVDPGLFSQTLEFSDISYQSARREAKESVFSAWCQLFDSIGEDVALQLSVVNTPIPAEEIGHRSFFAESGRTAALAEEYNRILNDKMREGVSNLVRSRYITFSVGARDVESAVPRLARIRGDVTQSLQRIRCDATAARRPGSPARDSGAAAPRQPSRRWVGGPRGDLRAAREGPRVPQLHRGEARGLRDVPQDRRQVVPDARVPLVRL
ncbi:MAG: hypothetical protein LKE76_05675 [Atopobiaceae bacterium]|jgi:hypothetical protein|nr:hypothetical protein [Atopobiaceae bacterium]